MTTHTTEMKIGNTLYIVRSECSPNATETLEEKLERLILRHLFDVEIESETCKKPLDKSHLQSEYGTNK